MRFTACLLGLSAIASCAFAADPAPYGIPSQKGFHYDYGTRLPGDVLDLSVTPDPGYQLTAGIDNGTSAGWSGGPAYTCIVPLSFAGVHEGHFKGNYWKDGGEGTPPEWNGSASAGILKLTSETVLSAPDGTPDTRLKIAVTEKVTITANFPVDQWYAPAGDPHSGPGGTTFAWKAPEVGGSYSVFALVGSRSAQITFEVIPPSDVVYNLVAKLSPPAGFFGVRLQTTPNFEPMDVCFEGVGLKEQGGSAADPVFTTGFFAWYGTLNSLNHGPNPSYIPSDDSNYIPIVDEAKFQFFNTAANISHISPSQNLLHYRIPNLFEAGSTTDQFLKNISQDQSVSLSAGIITSQVSKAGLSHSVSTHVPP